MPNERPTTILIAEDQAITRFGLKCALESFEDLKVVGESADGVAVVLQALALKPNVILMDIGLPKVDGIKAARQIKEALPGVRIIIFTSHDDVENIYAALSAGADGYCLKNVAGEHLYAAIKAVTKGVAWLDPGIADRVLRSRTLKDDVKTQSGKLAKPDLSGDPTLNENQMLILHMLSQGANLEEVAQKFNMGADTVAKMVNATIAKLNASAGRGPSEGSESEPAPSATEPPRPTLLADRYAIDSVLGRGGMGIVYKGRHLMIGRPVAIKMLHPEYADDELIVRRFQSEAKSLSALSHPNLVAVHDFGITGGKEPYMVMDFHDGRGLDDLIETGTNFTCETATHIFRQVCDALTAVHKHGIIHRDIKPSNIIVSEDGEVKLVDFGIARSKESVSMNLTMIGEVVGTPKYMSPEQCTGNELGISSDIYALGCVMYELFAGRPPFEAETFYEMVRKHVDMPPPQIPLSQPKVACSPQMKQIILRCLQKDPARRYANAEQLKADLETACQTQAIVA